ncbi:hypothetical protein TrLO_g11538 [Triparma laevis f. longispina]|uniref:Uncharacterized protein n=1 Tax=Triparma laevis f. longispina TaxID=1714387 RepID=A0A9W7FAR6_9STRA|nr:hypothetical protein TrLO_g11538 [Triparma laevis f. longispina]
MSKNTPFDGVAVPESADVIIDFCEEARSEPAECTITGADGDSDSVNVPAKCCSALNAWQELEIDASTTAMGDCEAFDLCAGSCGNMLEAVWDLQDDSGDDEDKAAAVAARTDYESFCALFIDHHDCNVIIAHSMGNPTMAEVYRMSGNDAKYMWYDTDGPMKGSTTATGAKAIVMKGLTVGMGYAGTGMDTHNAVRSIVPTATSKWTAHSESCVNDAISWSSAAYCSPEAGGSHLQLMTTSTSWFNVPETTSKRVSSQVKKCQKKWWKFWCWVDGTYENGGETKVSAAGVVEAGKNPNWSHSNSNNWYYGDMTHLDGTGASGDGSHVSQQPNHWFKNMIGKPITLSAVTPTTATAGSRTDTAPGTPGFRPSAPALALKRTRVSR